MRTWRNSKGERTTSSTGRDVYRRQGREKRRRRRRSKGGEEITKGKEEETRAAQTQEMASEKPDQLASSSPAHRRALRDKMRRRRRILINKKSHRFLFLFFFGFATGRFRTPRMRCRRGKLDQNCKVRFFSPMTTAASLIGEMYNGMEKKKILQVFILPVRRYRLCRQIERGREIFGAGSSLQLLSSSCVFDGRLRRRQRRGWAAGQGKHQFRSLLYPHMHPLGYIHPISSIISPLRMSRREMKARGTRRRGGKKKHYRARSLRRRCVSMDAVAAAAANAKE